VNTLSLEAFDAILLDLDGTIWHESVPLPGAVELVDLIRNRGQKYGFVSNSGSSPRRAMNQLAAMGITAAGSQVLTAAGAGCDYVLETFGEGARVLNVANDSVDELLRDHVAFVEDDRSPCDVVVAAGIAHGRATPERLQWALRHLMRGAKLVGLCADRAYPTPRGFEIGAGGVAAMLAYAANVTPTYCGKPEAWFFLDLCKRLSVDPWRCVLIGDNLEADIAGAKRVGMKTVLTLTGLATRIAGESAAADQRPDRVVTDLRELLA
jgi:HAD superfamily hydrolase (TIGR01450 family)